MHPKNNAAPQHHDAAKLLLRILLAGTLLFHGVGKLIGGVEPIAGMLSAHGLPPVLAYGAYIGEVIAPLFLLVGLYTRAAALVVAINMLFALGLAHTDQFFTLAKTGGWALELQAFFLFTALAIALLGAGRYSIGGLLGRWN